MDMYAPITVTSRVELFTRKNAAALKESRRRTCVSSKSDMYSVDIESSGLNLVDFGYGNGFNADAIKSTSPKTQFESSRTKFRALHIEDDEAIRFLVKAFLKNYVEVDFAADGHEALYHTSTNKYDLIITDINLGTGINGIEATREIRNMMNYHSIPIIAATANADTDIKNQCIEVGMDAFLLKPFMKKELIHTIEQVMDNRK